MERRTVRGAQRFRLVALLVGVMVAGVPMLVASAGPRDPSGQAFPGGLGVIAHTCSGSGLDICRIDIDGATSSNLTSSTLGSSWENLPA